MSVYLVFNYLLLNIHSKIIFQFFARGKQYMLQPLAHPTTPKVWIHFYLAEQKAWPAFDLPVPVNDIKNVVRYEGLGLVFEGFVLGICMINVTIGINGQDH